jgi:hypothetical protein
MNKSKGDLKRDLWKLHFHGGPLGGTSKPYPYVPIPRYGIRDQQTSVQYWYLPTEIDHISGNITMRLATESSNRWTSDQK